jgi:hypothetical protein
VFVALRVSPDFGLLTDLLNFDLVMKLKHNHVGIDDYRTAYAEPR